MADIFSKEKRSEIMSKITSKSMLEQRVCKMLSAQIYPMGLRYRRNYRSIDGTPDIVFVSRQIAIFIDGTFWHGYNFDSLSKKIPSVYWKEKIEGNIRRDRLKRNRLRRQGWKVVRIWEHDFKKNPEACIRKVMTAIAAKEL